MPVGILNLIIIGGVVLAAVAIVVAITRGSRARRRLDDGGPEHDVSLDGPRWLGGGNVGRSGFYDGSVYGGGADAGGFSGGDGGGGGS